MSTSDRRWYRRRYLHDLAEMERRARRDGVAEVIQPFVDLTRSTLRLPDASVDDYHAAMRDLDEALADLERGDVHADA
jgi:hypothetical protein